MRARRALLYVPGDDNHKIHKAASLDVDSICLDLEDGVARNKKPVARETITRALQDMDFGRSERLVRINPVHSAEYAADLEEILRTRPDGIVLPKVMHGDQIRRVSQQISAAEGEHNWPPGDMILIAIVESALAITNLDNIASADPRLEALIFGAEDFAADIGARRSTSGWEVFYARSAIVTHAAAQQLQAIDLVNINFQDDEELRLQSERGARMGFSGKQVIHPNQIEIVQHAFTPSADEIQAAVELIEKFNQEQELGRGAFAVEGVMIDAPAIKAAQSIIERARAAGKITPQQSTRIGGDTNE
jgi:citrate lyase beta subunit